MTSPVDPNRFGGITRLYGRSALERLARAHVAIIGVGGVGSWAVEALARSGVGRLTLIDMDDVSITNSNRQLHALEGEIGRPKVDVLAERVRSINPGCGVTPVKECFSETSAERLLEFMGLDPGHGCDWVIDAVDRTGIKALIITKARERSLPVLTIGGAGGRRDPAAIRTGDLARSGGDRLLKQVRKLLRQQYEWPAGNGEDFGVPAVFSAEPQIYPRSDGTVSAKPEPASHLRKDGASGYGTACFVTGAFGFVAAAEVVRRITQEKPQAF